MVKKKTAKQQRLIDCYAGNIKEAAEKAEISYGTARNLMTKSDIVQAIRNRQETEIRPKTIATRQERQEFWTKNMRDETLTMDERRKNSELLGKSEIDFGDKRIQADVSLADIAARVGSRRRQIDSEARSLSEGTEAGAASTG